MSEEPGNRLNGPTRASEDTYSVVVSSQAADLLINEKWKMKKWNLKELRNCVNKASIQDMDSNYLEPQGNCNTNTLGFRSIDWRDLKEFRLENTFVFNNSWKLPLYRCHEQGYLTFKLIVRKRLLKLVNAYLRGNASYHWIEIKIKFNKKNTHQYLQENHKKVLYKARYLQYDYYWELVKPTYSIDQIQKE